MGTNIKILIGFGTRPELIKIYPLYSFFAKKKNIKCDLIFTNQHDKLITNLIKKLNLNIKYIVNIKTVNRKRTLNNFIGQAILNIERKLKKSEYDLIIAQGDTSSTFILALYSYLNNYKFAHLEAGLRTNDIYNPFPEEAYRQMISKISNYHFSPTKKNYQNLIDEKVSKNKICITGNTSIDFLNSQKIIKNFNKKNKILITIHRRENIGKFIERFIIQLKKILKNNKDIDFVHIKHANPVFHEYFKKIKFINYKIINPLEYSDFIQYIQNFNLVISDSGGLQEECISLKIPLIVYREKTERTEGLKFNFIKLSKPSKNNLEYDFNLFIKKYENNKFIFPKINPYGDGTASQKIYKFLEKQWNQ